MRINTDEATAITKRFFFAIEYLVIQKKLRGLGTFAKKYNINYWNLYTLRKEPERRILKVEYIAYLVKDYEISPWYILFGTGSITNIGMCEP